MNHHKLKVHSSEEDLRVACDECDMSYSTRAALNRHKSVEHLGLKEYQCEECPAKFARDGVLLDNQFNLLFYAHMYLKIFDLILMNHVHDWDRGCTKFELLIL